MISAAIFTVGLIENVTAAQWSEIFDVNVRGYALMAKHIVPLLKQQRSGSIVQFGSISGLIAQPAFAPYAATKAAVIQMTRNLALDLGSYNVRCNSVSPGCIGRWIARLLIRFGRGEREFLLMLETAPILRLAASRSLSMEQFTQTMAAGQCLKRLGSAQEIANLVVFLASDLCPFITGANLVADGGYTTL